MLNSLEYSITRPFTLRYLGSSLIVAGIFWASFVTLISVATLGYDNIVIQNNSFNESVKLWYEKLLPNSRWVPQGKVCDPSEISTSTVLTTYGNGFTYQLAGFVDPTVTTTFNEIQYGNYPLQNCSVRSLQVLQLNQPVGQLQSFVACNTSINQYLVLDVSRTTIVNPQIKAAAPPDLSDQASLNLLSAMAIWGQAENGLIDLFSPSTRPSLLYPAVATNNLSFLSLTYLDTLSVEGSQNTPARDVWSILVNYGFNNDTVEYNVTLSFLASTGKIDFSRTSMSDYQTANTLLSTTNSSLSERAAARGIKSFDIWELINWLVVSTYWTLLADLGQIYPTTYAPGDSVSLFTLTADTRTAARQSSANNVFVNNTLFTLYSEYLEETVLPLLDMPLPPAPFAPLNDVNRLYEVEMTFFQTYSCTIRQLRSPLEVLVSVAVADYAFIKGAYSIFMLCAAWLQKRKYRENNFCEGHCAGSAGAEELHKDGFLVCCEDCLKLSRVKY